MKQFETCDITTWTVMSQEARGLDEKDWIVPEAEISLRGQAHWWLYKPAKAAGYRRYDDWSEKIASELASMLGLPAAQVEMARGLHDEGIISKNVTPNGWSMESGDTLLSEFDGYVSTATEVRDKNRVGHNLSNIQELLAGAAGPPGSAVQTWSAFDVFAGYLVLDAWIANTDRHAINWGVLTSDEDGSQALAPSFDHGTALASGTQDLRLTSTTPEAFAARGYAHRFEDGAKVPLVSLAFDAVQLASPQALEWFERLASLSSAEIKGVVGCVPGMSEPRRTFICTLLDINRKRLTP